MSIYLIGSLRNPRVPVIAAAFRDIGHDVFDDWFAAGPNADDHWRDYERERGSSYEEALRGYSARHTFAFDCYHLDRANAAVLVMPAGKSSHLELGYILGRGKPGYVLFDDGEPERWDVMYQFATKVFSSLDDLIRHFQEQEA